MKMPSHSLLVAAVLALAALALALSPAQAQDGPLPFSRMLVKGGVANDGNGGSKSTLTFEVDFSLNPKSNGLALGKKEGDQFMIETSIPLVPMPPPQGATDEIRRTLVLNIAVKGDCFRAKNRRFTLLLRGKDLERCVDATLQPPGFNPIPLPLLQSMQVTLWPLGRADRWRMRSAAKFASPDFGYPVAGFGPGSWTALVIGDDGGRVGTSAILFEGEL